MTGQIIKHLAVENVRGIKRLSFAPQDLSNELIVKIEGGNGEGKSSLLDGLRLLFESKDAKKEIKHIVRNGEEKAKVVAELSDMTITKMWTKSGKSRTEIITKEGAKISNPAELIHNVIGQLASDPTKLMNQTTKEMTETFLKSVDSDEDFDAMEIRKKEVYSERTIINRLKNAAATKRNSYSLKYPDAPDEERSVAELSNKLTDAQAIENQHTSDKETLKRFEASLTKKHTELSMLNQEIELLEQHKTDIETSILNYVDPGTQDLRIQISNVEEINQQVRYLQEKDKTIQEYNELNDKSNSLSADLQQIQDTKDWVLQHAKLPIDGLSFNEDGLTFNKIPLSDCCTSEKMEACAAICMGINVNENGIKVMLIHHGNQLDKTNLKKLCDLCTAQGYQLWIEIVTMEPSGVGIFIEDGEIKDE